MTPPVIALLALLVGLALGAGALALLRRPIPPPTQFQSPPAPDQLQTLREEWRRMRHDVNGALSPAMLTADRLANNADPAISKAGNVILSSLQRSLDIMRDPARGAPPPGGQ